jgi:hypothetical protein
VEFLWPSVDLPLVRGYANSNQVLRVTSDTESGRFSLTGEIDIRSGEVFYFERSFYMRTGTLSFNENEVRFDPRISTRAESRDQNDDGPVTLSLVLNNQPLNGFVPRLESSPALSQSEILALLGQSVSGQGQDTIISPPLADIFMQFGVVRRVERAIRDFLFLDMFSFRTQIIQNALIKAIPVQGSTQIDTRFGNYLDNSTVFIGKYIGSSMFAQAMLSIRYDSKYVDFQGIRLEADLGLELRSPLFDVRFNFVPEHPENIFMNDVSVSITWRKTF